MTSRGLEAWTPPETLSKRTQDKLLLPVPLVPVGSTPRARPRVVMLNFDELERLGVDVGDRIVTPELEREILERFALRPVESGESGSRLGIATRYEGYPGAVQGDGRAVLLAKARRIVNGRPRERVDVQVKGIATGLLPRRKDWTSRHGKMVLDRGLQEAFYAAFLEQNGVATNRWLAIIDLGATVTRPTDNVELRVGLHVRSGQFWRMGHLWHFARDQKALRDVTRELGRLLADERGRRTPPSAARMWAQLARRKAVELADSWWLRYAHGSFTPDNVGLFESMDQGTACTVDRTHVSFSAHRMGFGHAPEVLMEEDYKRYLPGFLASVQRRPERQRLERIPWAQVARGFLRRRMEWQLLRHLGLDERQVRHALHRHRPLVESFFSLFRSLCNQVDRDRETRIGTKGPFRVRHGATYDMFPVLPTLSALARRGWDLRRQALALLPVMRPETDRTGLDLKRAVLLIEHFDGLLKAVLGNDAAERINATLLVWNDRARALGRRTKELEGADSLKWAEHFVAQRQQGVSAARLRAWLNGFLRRNVIDGPGSAPHAARQLRRGRFASSEDGRVVVTRCVENGVTIEQLSDGVRDVLRFRVSRRHFEGVAPETVRLELRWGAVRLPRALTSETRDALFFEVPVDESAPRQFRARFVSPGRRVTNGGHGFGAQVRLLFSSLDVQLELARYARQRGLTRPIDPAMRPLI